MAHTAAAVARASQAALEEEERGRNLAWIAGVYRREFAYYETSAPIAVGRREVPGIELPTEILHRFYYANADRWYPGLV